METFGFASESTALSVPPPPLENASKKMMLPGASPRFARPTTMVTVLPSLLIERFGVPLYVAPFRIQLAPFHWRSSRPFPPSTQPPSQRSMPDGALIGRFHPLPAG